MIPKKITNPLKTGLQIFLLLAIVALSLGPSVKPVFAAPPSNDDFDPNTATPVGALPYTNTIGIHDATPDGPSPISCTDADGEFLNVFPKNSVWYKYIPTSTTTVVFDTFGSDFDTFIAVWTGDSLATLTPAGTPHCSDDTFQNTQSSVTLSVTSGTTYYIEIGRATTTTYGNLVFHVSSGIRVTIGGNLQGSYGIPSGQSVEKKYAVNGGPVVISSSNGADIIASLFQLRRALPTGGFTGVAQSMAFPVAQITNSYVIPRYKNGTDKTLYDAILMANVDTVPRDITVTIGGTPMGTYTLQPSESIYRGYVFEGGPVVVSSVAGAKIVASLYELKRAAPGVGWNGQSEMMGLPSGQLSDKYLIPIYFGAELPFLDASLNIGVP